MSEENEQPQAQPAAGSQQATPPPRFDPDPELIDYSRRGRDLASIQYPEQGQRYSTKERRG